MVRDADLYRPAISAVLSGAVPLKPGEQALLARVLRTHIVPRPEVRATLDAIMERARFRIALQETMR